MSRLQVFLFFTFFSWTYRYYKFNTLVGSMTDAYSVIVNDSEKFTSLLSSVIWRPTNLTSLASASLGASSTKPSSFFAAVIYATISTYVLVLLIDMHYKYRFFGTFTWFLRYCVATGLQPGNLTDLWTGLSYCLVAVVFINIPTFKHMSRVAEQRAKCEAAFKFVHSRIRLHAETIALYAAENVEASEIARSFDAVVLSSKSFIIWQSIFQGLQVAFQIAPSIVAGA
jgi:ABC-type uncharacterized transport system fused permease/ATPase subunit